MPGIFCPKFPAFGEVSVCSSANYAWVLSSASTNSRGTMRLIVDVVESFSWRVLFLTDENSGNETAPLSPKPSETTRAEQFAAPTDRGAAQRAPAINSAIPAPKRLRSERAAERQKTG